MTSTKPNEVRADELLPWQLQWMFDAEKLSRYRFIALYGGRAGTKSWSAARTLAYHGAQRPMRILCAREIQNSIGESSKQAIEQAITDLDLSDFYTINRTRIDGINGTTFLFRGLSKVTAGTIKSYESIDVAWLEEAQDISEESWGLLLPTIRKPGSQIWVTFNPTRETDVVYRYFVSGDKPKNSFVLKINYDDIDFSKLRGVDDAGLKEIQDAMAYDRLHNSDVYRHRWYGEINPDVGVLPVLPMRDLKTAVELYPRYAAQFAKLPCSAGFDVSDGGKDNSAWALRRGPLIEDVRSWADKIEDATRRVDELTTSAGAFALYYDATGLGTGVRGLLAGIGRRRYLVNPITFSEAPRAAFVKFDGFHNNYAMFNRINAQMAWAMKLRLQKTARLASGDKINPMDCLFINPEILDRGETKNFLIQMNQPTWSDEGKIRVKKGAPSPDMFDASGLAFMPDCEKGLRS